MRGIPAAVVIVGAALCSVRAQLPGPQPQCVVTCMASAAKAASCSDPANWGCLCTVSSFRAAVDRCFASACSMADAQIGENMVNIQCSGQTSTSIPPPFSPPTTTTSPTSSPQPSSPAGPSHPTNTLAPPIPPSSSPGPPPASTAPGPTPAPTQTAPGTAPTTSPPAPGTSPASLSPALPLTSPSTGTVSSATNGTTSGVIAPSNGTAIGPSATPPTPPDATQSQGSGAGRAGLRGDALALFGALLGVTGAWFL